MSSFFEKLKKGMGIEEAQLLVEEKEEKTEPIKTVPKKRKSAEASITPKKVRVKKPLEEKRKIEITAALIEEEPKPEEEEKKEEIKEEIEEKPPQVTEKKEKWPSLGGEQEGQLAVDVYQTDKYLVIQAAIAGIETKDLDISFEREVITIKGWRGRPLEEEGDYFTQECFWGQFSREVILPVEIDPERAEAVMKEGVLTIRAPKILKEKKRKISIKNI